MGLKASRKVMSIIFSIVICASTVCMLVSAVLSATFAAPNFIAENLITDEVVEECEKQLSAQFETLEAESGIPARVFKTITVENKKSNIRDNMKLAASHIFTEESSELYSKEKEALFYNYCVEYLDGNDIKYNESDVKLVAQRAAEIYSNTIGIHNSEIIKEYLSTFGQNCAKASSVSLLAIVVCTVLLMIMYRKKDEPVSYLAGGVAGGGVAVILGAFISLVSGAGKSISVAPAVYQLSFVSMTRTYFIRLIISGLVVLAVGVLTEYIIYNKNLRERIRKRIKFAQIITKS